MNMACAGKTNVVFKAEAGHALDEHKKQYVKSNNPHNSPVVLYLRQGHVMQWMSIAHSM
jgi:hypothetical protein